MTTWAHWAAPVHQGHQGHPRQPPYFQAPQARKDRTCQRIKATLKSALSRASTLRPALIGFAGIRNLALSVLLLERMQDKAHVQRLRQELLQSLLAAQLSQALTPYAADEEEAYLAALFHKLGRLMAHGYLPEQAQQIDQMCQGVKLGAAEMAHKAEVAAPQVLGLGLRRWVWASPRPGGCRRACAW